MKTDYVKYFLNTLKIRHCDASSIGLLLYVMCMIRELGVGGTLPLHKNYKTSENIHMNYADYIHIFYRNLKEDKIETGLRDLVYNEVLFFKDGVLCHQELMNDSALSETRRNSGNRAVDMPTKKLYSLPGYLYIMKSRENPIVYKIGVSKNVEKRRGQLSCKVNKTLSIVKKYPVSNMGKIEDIVLNKFNDNRKDEWVYGLSEAAVTEIVEKALKENG